MAAASLVATPVLAADKISISGTHTDTVEVTLSPEPGSSVVVDKNTIITPPVEGTGLVVHVDPSTVGPNSALQVISNGTITVSGDGTSHFPPYAYGMLVDEVPYERYPDVTKSVVINYATINAHSGANGAHVGSGWKFINRGRISVDAFVIGEGMYIGSGGVGINEGYIHVGGSNMIALSGYYETTLINRGVISGAGTGMSERNNGTVINSGTIITTGDDALGIESQDGAVGTYMKNTGGITTLGQRAHGIYGRSNGEAINEGSIGTSGDGADGIDLAMGYNSQIINQGRITTTGTGAAGIHGIDFLGAGIPVTKQSGNAGTIETSGAASHGVLWEVSNASFTNSGRIVVTGAGSDGIFLKDKVYGYPPFVFTIPITNAKFRNTGLIAATGAGGKALHFTTAGDFIEFSGQSFVQGAIDLGDGTDVSFGMGPSHSIHLDLSQGTLAGTPVNNGPAPLFYDSASKQAATFDPTGVTMPRDSAAVLGQTIASLIAQRLANPGSAASVSGGPHREAFMAPSNLTGASGSWWATGFGSVSQIGGSGLSLPSSVAGAGMAFGYDQQIDAKHMLGVFAGPSHSYATASSAFSKAQENSADGAFAGVFGRSMFGSTFFDFALLGGIQQHNAKRVINNNLGNGGIETASSDFASYWVQPQLRFGVQTSLGGWQAVPSLGVSGNWVQMGRTTETGSAANAKVGGGTFNTLSADAELALSHTLGRGTFTARFGSRYAQAGGDAATNITLLGMQQNVDLASLNTLSGFAAASYDLPVSAAASVRFAGEASVSAAAQSFGSSLTVNIKF